MDIGTSHFDRSDGAKIAQDIKKERQIPRFSPGELGNCWNCGGDDTGVTTHFTTHFGEREYYEPSCEDCGEGFIGYYFDKEQMKRIWKGLRETMEAARGKTD